MHLRSLLAAPEKYMFGLKRGIVRFEPHTEKRHALFTEEANRLRVAIGQYLLAVEHVGSTAKQGFRLQILSSTKGVTVSSNANCDGGL